MIHSKKEAIDFLFKDTIQTGKLKDCFLGTEFITNLSDTGSTEEEAIKNVKQILYKHFEIVEKKLSEKREEEKKSAAILEEIFKKSAEFQK